MTIREAFNYGPWAYNIDQLRALLVEQPREPIRLSIVDLVVPLGRGWVTVDAAVAAKADIEDPLLIVPYPSKPGLAPVAAYDVATEQEWLVIDGWHRVAGAIALQRFCLPAIPFTGEEADAARFIIPSLHEVEQ